MEARRQCSNARERPTIYLARASHDGERTTCDEAFETLRVNSAVLCVNIRGRGGEGQVGGSTRDRQRSVDGFPRLECPVLVPRNEI